MYTISTFSTRFKYLYRFSESKLNFKWKEINSVIKTQPSQAILKLNKQDHFQIII